MAPRFRSTSLALCAALAAILVLAPPMPIGSPGPAHAQVGRDEFVVPNFWDPRRRVTRPLQGEVSAIRFVTTDDFPPFNFVDDAGRLTGFHVDLAREICDELDLPCTIQARPWDNLIPTLEDGRADAIIAGIAISAENRQRVDFSDVYFRDPARFVVRQADAAADMSPDGLTGRAVGVVSKTAHEAYLAAYFPDVQRRLYDTADEARAALKDGAVDAYFGDAIQLSFWLLSDSAGGCCVFAGGPYLDTHFFGHGFAIAIRPDSPALRDALNSALATLYSNGRYGELYLRYFPIGLF